MRHDCWGSTVAPLPTTLVAAAILGLLARRLSRRALAAALVAFVAGALLGRLKLERFEESRVRARDAFGAPQRCTLEGAVHSSPSWTGRASYLLRVGRADCDAGSIAPDALVDWYAALVEPQILRSDLKRAG